MKEITAFNRTWVCRQGKIGLAPTTWNDSMVSLDPKGVLIRCSPGRSGGIQLKEPLGYGTYVFEFLCRTGALDPSCVLAAWLRAPDSTPTNISETTAEFSAWTDSNNYLSTLLTVFPKVEGQKPVQGVEQVKLPGRCFYRHKVEFKYLADRSEIRVSGFWELNNKWMQFGELICKRPNPPKTSPRFGLWLINDKYTALDAKEQSCLLTAFSYSP